MTSDARRPEAIPEARPAAGGAARRHTGRIALQVALFLFYMGAWEYLVDSGAINAYILPAPSQVLKRLYIDFHSIVTGGYMARHFFVTVLEVLMGLGVAIVLAVVLGAAIAESNFFRVSVYPYVVAVNATPRVAFAPLFLIWFGFGIWSKVAMVVAIAAFPIMVGTIAGLAASDPHMEKLMRSLGASRWQTFTKVRLKLALPYLFAGLETGVILAVIGAIVGEFAGGSEGLGYIIAVSQQQLDLPQGFSALVMLSLTGVVLHQATIWLQRRVVYWRPKGH